jgi:hypothetical protein
MYKPHHGPMSNNWVLVSFFGIIIAVSIWKLSSGWAFLLILFSIIFFLASYISAIRAPLDSDADIELAVHERYSGKKYPKTDLHHGMIPKTKKIVHTRHKKKLVSLLLESEKKPVAKSVVKPAVKPVVKAPVVSFAKKSLAKQVAKVPVKKPLKKR